jgi:signal transduction histidine kinase
MKKLKKFKPAFWDHRGNGHTGLNFARKWKLIVVFTSFMALLPLFVMTLVEFSLTRRIIEDEVKAGMGQILDSAAAAINPSADPRPSALEYLGRIHRGEANDLFVVDEHGTLVSPSFYYGNSGTPTTLRPGLFGKKSGIERVLTPGKKPVIAGYAGIPNSRLHFVLIKSEKWLTDLWFKPRFKLIGYLGVSIALILLSIMGTATYLVGRIHAADQKRTEAIHSAEYANKLASIGRLATGVAHEINNPLAIINQKTGLIMDLLTLKGGASTDERLIPLAENVLDAVKRCGTITRRLLDFTRDMEPIIKPVDLGEVLGQMLAFLEKEAQRRNITIIVENRVSIPEVECDRGSLQQIFFNLFDNAFGAMKDGGHLDIRVESRKDKTVTINVCDDGSGIAEEDIHKIFEPFFSTKDHHWGKGLGLYITYGLVKELGGDIRVKSRRGEGTCFTLTLPLKPENRPQTKDDNDKGYNNRD